MHVTHTKVAVHKVFIVSIVAPNRSNTYLENFKIKSAKVKIRNHPEVYMIIHCFKQCVAVPAGFIFLFLNSFIPTSVSIAITTKRICLYVVNRKNKISTTDNLIRPSSYVRRYCAYRKSVIDISHKMLKTKMLLNTNLDFTVFHFSKINISWLVYNVRVIVSTSKRLESH